MLFEPVIFQNIGYVEFTQYPNKYYLNLFFSYKKKTQFIKHRKLRPVGLLGFELKAV